MKDVTDPSSAAPTAPTSVGRRWLGLFALLPLLGCGLQVVSGWPLGPRLTGPALFLLGTYAAVVLSFLAGVRHGRVAASGGLLRPAVWLAAAGLAWFGLWLGARAGLVAAAAGLAVLLADDVWLRPADQSLAKGSAGFAAAALLVLLAAATFGPF